VLESFRSRYCVTYIYGLFVHFRIMRGFYCIDSFDIAA
jgi:hypothetical protein